MWPILRNKYSKGSKDIYRCSILYVVSRCRDILMLTFFVSQWSVEECAREGEVYRDAKRLKKNWYCLNFILRPYPNSWLSWSKTSSSRKRRCWKKYSVYTIIRPLKNVDKSRRNMPLCLFLFVSINKYRRTNIHCTYTYEAFLWQMPFYIKEAVLELLDDYIIITNTTFYVSN